MSKDSEQLHLQKSLDLAPTVKQIPKNLEIHQDTRQDPYYWLNKRDHPEVLEYINQENAYFEKQTAHLKDFKDDLFSEMKARIKEDDSSVPYLYNGYWYKTRYEKNKDYPIYTRWEESLAKDELSEPAIEKQEVLIDVNLLAKNQDYYKARGLSISPNNQFLAYGEDLTGRRQYTLKIKNLHTGELLDTNIEGTTGSVTWANDSKTFFYTHNDPETLRSNKIMRHVLGTNNNSNTPDVLIYEEADETFDVFIFKTKSRQYLCIGTCATLTSEFRILNADTPYDEFKIFQERIEGLEYGFAHYKNTFYIHTNADGAVNFKLMKTSNTQTEKKYWQEVIPHREDTLLEDVDIFKDYLVTSERTEGLTQIRIEHWESKEIYYLPFESETYMVYSSINMDFDSEIFRYGYNALNTPTSIIAFNMRTKKSVLLKEQEVEDVNFDKNNYTCKRLWATARDGKKIPMSVIYKKGLQKDGSNPLLQYGYGSYGHTIDPYFSTTRLSLLDRGFIYVITHIRGGEYLGRPWYDTGKLLAKKNTFTDFIDCSEFLIAQKYTSPEHLYAMGGSAGGLLMGVIANWAPQLYNGILASVPFVDVVTTMLDESIPLTTGEYDEWGNPNEEAFYNYIKSYSPYDNVTTQEYPNMLIITGYHDSQVQYWEPLKWVAKLRKMKKGNQKLLLKTNMEAGHSGASGRFEALKELAEEFCFLFELEGIRI